VKALIDGDILVYRCGFAAEKNDYKTSHGNFRYKKEIPEGATIHEVERIIEPVENALNNVKTVLREIGERISEKFSEDRIELELYLTGNGNFRDELATIKVYKGNRDKNHRPHWYTEIQDYMKTTWKAETVDGIEADDVLSDLQTDETCIVSTDKDLDQVPGWHYNWVKADLYYVSVSEARHMLYKQILTGDSTDNIEGIPGVGEKTAIKMLEGSDDYEQTVRDAYEDYFTSEKGSQKCAQYLMTWEDILAENRALVTLGTILTDFQHGYK